MFRVDPQHAVLAEFHEDKPRDLWLAQLAHDPDPIGRILAARTLAAGPPPSGALPSFVGQRESGKLWISPAVTDALASALGDDPFWGVRREIATLLGAIPVEAARDALQAGTQDTHSKVRDACSAALARWRRERPNSQSTHEE
jgi:aminopeptidase N